MSSSERGAAAPPDTTLQAEIALARGAFDMDIALRIGPGETLVLVGFSTNHCVDATARQGSDQGFRLFIVSDATAAFERVGPDGKLLGADEILAVALANLHQEFGVVLTTAELLPPPREL